MSAMKATVDTMTIWSWTCPDMLDHPEDGFVRRSRMLREMLEDSVVLVEDRLEIVGVLMVLVILLLSPVPLPVLLSMLLLELIASSTCCGV
eukprot:CAMPEP_0171298716 /NCGR_PEP_ID=MMETSP0816-20121228/7507_1 /TAXON_ID=420281 /ORGANISM="Proboscia inermis, Strain CCAP1064/1" /LENGTH=90 /DNA_ID=CAMNT_0011773967 /DNA_START=434 /DNA_END=706 /DNA_ORIENTATION=+